jgi:hypothetical protein
MLRRPLSIKKACWRPYTGTVGFSYLFHPKIAFLKRVDSHFGKIVHIWQYRLAKYKKSKGNFFSDKLQQL